jgi:hypothetical protein
VSTTIINYRVRPHAAGENQRLIEEMLVAIASHRPAGLHYTAIRLDDGVSFMHVVSATSGDVLTSLPAFQAFRENLPQRIEPGSRTERHEQSLGA